VQSLLTASAQLKSRESAAAEPDSGCFIRVERVHEVAVAVRHLLNALTSTCICWPAIATRLSRSSCRTPDEANIEGEPADVTAIAAAYADWLATSGVPKLFVKAEPGLLVAGGANLDFALQA
jgi:hypothetical protein